MDTQLEEIDDADLKDHRNSCNHFFVGSEVENGRHCAFIFAMPSFSNSILNGKLDQGFSQLECATKVKLAIGFVLKNIEDGTCRYFCAQKNYTVMERSNLVCTQNDIVNLREKWQKVYFFSHCRRDKANNKNDFKNLQMVQFLLRQSITYPSVVKMLYYLNNF